MEHVKGSAPMKVTVITKQHSGLIIEMERLLVLWLEEQNQRRIPVSLMVIQEKAKRLFEALKEEKGEGSESEEFVASRGWFMRFKARANYHNLKVQGEAASGDEKAASEFPKVLAEMIKEGDYSAHQVFNVDETGLFWKHMPDRTYITKEEKSAPGHKASKDRVTLLLGSAAGDFKLKLLLVYQAENPRALKGIWKSQLPVIWKANKKAWVTLAVFEDWFINYFVPRVEWYLASKGIPFKVLLVLDNAPGHPAHLGDFNPNVKVVYLPPNTTALLQPMDQGVIASFKAYYLRRTIAMALQATETKKNLTLKDFWKSYNILDAVKNIADSWEEVKQTNMNGVWKKLCPQFVGDFHGFENTVQHVIKNVVALSKETDLEMDVDDVTELLESHGEELSAEDLIQLEKQIIEEEEAPTPEPRAFTRQGLARGFAEMHQALATFEAMDPNFERFTKVSRGIMDLMQCYKEILDEKRFLSVQTNLEQYFKKVERPATDPVPSTSAASTTPDSPAPESPAPSECSASPPGSPAPVSPAPGGSASPPDSPA
ncbi:tigger transposable element-derived protein 1-like [Portunus trituberculatus]|uniref:tigger transposable element-derived protein 1-like n=1 Tax=Portunus trituberculatus TaxID=210409 RepID=UPI001E1D14EC|nr:tigger transposable element-derived protein 1-like [Portunus trituberculatus]